MNADVRALGSNIRKALSGDIKAAVRQICATNPQQLKGFPDDPAGWLQVPVNKRIIFHAESQGRRGLKERRPLGLCATASLRE